MPTTTQSAPVAAADTMPANDPYADAAGTATASDYSAAPLTTTLVPGIEAGTYTLPLSPANTRIEFVGTHAGEKPDPRKGGFEKFTGKLEVDLVAKSLKSISLDIDTESLSTEIPKLTEHLKSPDFFEVREHPKATFESTKIVPSAESPGQLQITGNLTLHGVTKEITAPATVQIGPAGPSLRSELTLDRSEFGMNYSPDKVENKVSLTVVMGEKPPSPQP
jgi:polyisoprenoid-binding protein YceI